MSKTITTTPFQVDFKCKISEEKSRTITVVGEYHYDKDKGEISIVSSHFWEQKNSEPDRPYNPTEPEVDALELQIADLLLKKKEEEVVNASTQSNES